MSEQPNSNGIMKRKRYERELHRLQVELCRLQAWVKHKGLRAIIIFEGRDNALVRGTIPRDHRARQSAHFSRDRLAGALRPRKVPNVHATLHGPFPSRWGNRDF